ncbi:MAG: twin-arginine translocase subunit TatC [Flavisolibacter sp.]
MALSFFKRSGDHERAEMSFIEHLDALRGTLFRSVVAISIGAVVAGIYNRFIIKDILLGPTHDSFPTYGVICRIGKFFNLGNALCMQGIALKMQSTDVAGQFSMWFTVILVSGLVLAFPYVFLQFWKFIRPALTKKELHRTRGVIFWVSFLFFTGVLFGYLVVAPYAINFFFHFQLDEIIENRWTITSYIDMMLPLVLGSGLAFQLPLVMFFLAKIGVVTGAFLSRVRKYAIVIIFIVAGVITPGPDVVSQMAVAIPLLLLYEISIFLARRVDKEKAEEEKEWS